ncbi:MAG: GNAT family N-acetyltransferase [Deltaproteobacteria bacterium]|nr:GNAT family N-acetyltransferase [Deltaproteobacteria bacterium]
MKEDQIRIEKIKLKEIHKFARNALSQPPYQTAAPISLRRALSQSNNPYGRPDDVVLLVALRGDKCIGYQGLLPGLFCHNGKLKRVHWSTAFFVAPDYRGEGIAGCLLEEVKKLNIDFPVTRMTENARQAYLKAGFKELGNLNYYQLRMEKIRKLDTIFQEAEATLGLDRDPDEISKLNSDARQGKGVLYQRSKKVFYRHLLAGFKPKQQVFQHEAVAQIDAQAQQIIRRQLKNQGFFRGIEAINWMLKYRWIISAKHKKTEEKWESYYFSLVSELFDYVALEIYSADKKVFKGFLILSVLVKKGRTWVKILDFAFKDLNDGDLAAYFGLICAKKFSADRLEFPASLLDYFKQNPLLQPLIKEQQRLYLFYPKTNRSALEACIGGIRLDYCDADTAFT